MFRIGIACVLLLAASNGATAQSPAERGSYLVNTIMACGNCHSPRDAEGRMIPEKAFSGGLSFTTPAFIATAPNITPDVETGIGGWSDAEIRRALVEGMRPDHGRLSGVPLAAIMPRRSSGLVSIRARMTGPCLASSSALSGLKTRTPVAAPGPAARPWPTR